MNEILVVGSLGYDTVATPAGRADNVLGGSANFFAFAASPFAPVRVVGVVGSDYQDADFGLLKKRGVDVDGLLVKPGKTFRWSGRYEGDMNEAITLKTELNVFQDFSPEIPERYVNTPYVFLGNIAPELQMEVLEQIKSPRVVGLDTMNYWIDSKPSQLLAALRKVDVALLNEKEAQKLTGESNTIKAIQSIAALGPKAVVVKRGEYGFVLHSEEQFFILPAYPVAKVVDPTGAGDCFAGGFFGYLAKDNAREMKFETLKRACMFGTVVASFAVENFSVRGLMDLSLAQIDERLESYRTVVSP
jgi:sugar/nucleoside kinase (ribokinase family)